jgi:hypothetical protein
MNMNIPANRAGRLTVDDLDTRQRERAAVLEIAERIDAERRFGIWPPSRPVPLTECSGPCSQGRRACPCPDACERLQPADDDADGMGAARGIVIALGAVGLVAACIGFAFGLNWLFRSLP